jgi:hypothetical protein
MNFLLFICCAMRVVLVAVLLMGLSGPVRAQIDFSEPVQGKTHINLKFGGYFLINGGFGFSAALGSWTSFAHWQPGFNLSINLVASKTNLGNRDRYLTKWQINTILTPMLTYGGKRGLYQEISPFYFGSLGAVYANYRHSVTLGTNFVVMPRALGRNTTTNRNRTQQLIYLGLRTGGSDWDVNLNVCEDFFGTDNAALQGFADNYDRFYTGGGNLQLRTRNVTIKQYADIYTGNFTRDLFDSPDLYQPYQSDSSWITQDNCIGGPKRRRHPRYVAQDPGQKIFNQGRTFTVVELSPGAFNNPRAFVNNPTVQVYAGWQGGQKQMRVQNWIHGLSISTIDKVNPDFKPDSVHTGRRDLERLHLFYPAYEEGRFIYGAGFVLNTVPGLRP